jgi:hypothetical protein
MNEVTDLARAQRIGGGLSGEPKGWVNRFGGKLVLVLLDNKYTPSVRGGRSLWALHDPLTYQPSNDVHVITAAKGCVTDLASIPRPFWILLPPDGPWVKAAIIHDYLYATRGTGQLPKGVPGSKQPVGITRAQPYSRAEADWILRDGLKNRGVDFVRRNLIWAAVRIGGWRGWNRNGEAKRQEAAEQGVSEG